MTSHNSNLDSGLTLLLRRQEEAWNRGDRILIEALLTQLPSECERSAGILELVCNEVVLREAAGESPRLEEYQARFPEAADSLRVQWDINALLQGIDKQEEASDEPDIAVGHRIGRYQLLDEIGRGTMGIVYRAWDPRLKRIVAIKRLRGGADATPDELQRMRIEAEAVARVHHEHVVRIFDVVENDGQPYLAMEFCAGNSLANRIQKQPLEPRVAAELIKEVAGGVAAAHAVHVLHRDLKPANILLADSVSLVPKITDFGLAKQLDANDQATATGAILGSPAYMAPEQAFGEMKHVSTAADIYALGAILYECLTGRPPFRGATIADTLEQVRKREPVAIRQLQPSVALDLETIAHKCLRKDPAQRYATACELLDDLARFLDGRSIRARRETWAQATARTFRRYPVATSLAATAALLMILVSVGSLVSAKWLNDARLRSEQAEREAKKGQEDARRGQDAARLAQADALVGRAHGIRLSRRPGQRFEALSAIRQAVEIGKELGQPRSWYDPIRDQAIAALLLPDAQVERWRTDTQMVEFADHDDDVRIVALSLQNAGDVVLRRIADDGLVGSIPKPGKSASVRFVGNHRLLIMSQEYPICEMWDVSGAGISQGPPRRLWQLDVACWWFEVSRDRQRLVIVDSRDLRVVDSASGRILATLPTGPFTRECRVAIHPTLPLVALFSYFQPSVQLRNWETGETLQDVLPGEGRNDYTGYMGADWSPNGRQLVVLNGHSDAEHWYDLDLTSHRLQLARSVTTPPQSRGSQIRFNASGDRILSFGWANQLEIVDTQTNLEVIESMPVIARASGTPRCGPSTQFAGYFGHSTDLTRSGIMSIADAREARKLISAEAKVGGRVALDPTGRMLLGVVPDGLMFVEFPSGKHIVTLPLKDISVISFAFDHKGNFLLNGQTGCYRWPYRLRDAGGLGLEIGLPQRIHVPFGNVQIACSNDGQTVAAGAWGGFGTQEYAGCWIQPAGEPAARKLFGGLTSGNCTVSPDGSLVAALHLSRSILFESHAEITKKREYQGYGPPIFSLDGQWLLVAGRRFSTDSWNPDAKLSEGGDTSLSADGSLYLTLLNDGLIGLGDAATGILHARFEWQNPVFEAPPILSPNQKNIVFWSKGDVVTIDIARVRSGLQELGLDWESPNSGEPIEHNRSNAAAVVTSSSDNSRPLVQLAPELESIRTMDALSDLVDEQALARATSEPNNPYAAFDAAMVAIDRRELKLALDMIHRACELLPDAITPRLWRAYLFAAMRDYTRAVEDANWIIDRKGASITEIEQMAQFKTETGSPYEVPEFYEAPIEEDFRLLRAEWRYQAKQFEEAIADCSRLIQFGGKRWSQFAHGLRAACYESTNDWERAKLDQAKFVELTHHDPMTLNMAAGPMSGRDISLRQPTIALRLVRKLQSMDVELNEDVESTIGCVLFQNGLYEEAVQWLEQHLKYGKGERDGFDLYVLAMAYHQLGKTDIGQQCAARANAWQGAQQLDYRNRRDLQILRHEWIELSK